MSADHTETCDVCNEQFAPEELVTLRERKVCARCKPFAVQEVQEGKIFEAGLGHKRLKRLAWHVAFARMLVISMALWSLVTFGTVFVVIRNELRSEQVAPLPVVLPALFVGILLSAYYNIFALAIRLYGGTRGMLIGGVVLSMLFLIIVVGSMVYVSNPELIFAFYFIVVFAVLFALSSSAKKVLLKIGYTATLLGARPNDQSS